MPFPLEQAPFGVVAALFLLAAALVWRLGVRLTKALDALAERTGLGRAFVGMLLLGGITSLPELANVINASSAGAPRLAVNNLLGSAAINVFLLAAVDAVVGRRAVTAVQTQPATMMMCVLSMIVLILTAGAVVIGDIEVAGVGFWSVVISLASLLFFLLAASYERRAPWRVSSQASDPAPPGEAKPKRTLRSLVLETAGSGIAIFAAGYMLSATGEVIAERSGLGVGIVGFLFIGFATSLPELSTITTALKLRRYELAFGQVLGTNFVNLSFLLVADIAFTGGPVIDELGRFEIVLGLLGAILTGAFLVGLLERKDSSIMRMGYDSLVVIVVFLATSAYLVIAL